MIENLESYSDGELRNMVEAVCREQRKRHEKRTKDFEQSVSFQNATEDKPCEVCIGKVSRIVMRICVPHAQIIVKAMEVGVL